MRRCGLRSANDRPRSGLNSAPAVFPECCEGRHQPNCRLLADIRATRVGTSRFSEDPGQSRATAALVRPHRWRGEYGAIPADATATASIHDECHRPIRTPARVSVATYPPLLRMFLQ